MENQQLYLVDKSVAGISQWLMLREPFYGHFFISLVREISDSIPTMAVSVFGSGARLRINPEFWQQVLPSRKYRYGGIKHEILHLVFKHVLRIDAYADKRLFNLAADLVVNQYIASDELITGAVTFDSFPAIDFEAERELGYYYQKLQDFLQQYRPLMDWIDSQSSSTDTIIEFMPLPLRPDGSAYSQQELTTAANLRAAMDFFALPQQQHAQWKEFADLTDAEKALFESQLEVQIREITNKIKQTDYTNIPAGIRHVIDDVIEKLRPRFDWRRALRIFAATGNRTYLRDTLRRPSKRFGTLPGIKIKNNRRLLVAIDTSGSINDTDFNDFFTEIHAIWRTGSHIQLIECDCQIQRTVTYTGKRPEMVVGRGGTLFDPVIAYANEVRQADALIYFTDGYGPKPLVACRIPLLWVISSGGITRSHAPELLPGRIIKME
jgi:predicted metal-dependent peptidase